MKASVLINLWNISFYKLASPTRDQLVLLVKSGRRNKPHPQVQDHPQSDGRRPFRTAKRDILDLVSSFWTTFDIWW